MTDGPFINDDDLAEARSNAWDSILAQAKQGAAQLAAPITSFPSQAIAVAGNAVQSGLEALDKPASLGKTLFNAGVEAPSPVLAPVAMGRRLAQGYQAAQATQPDAGLMGNIGRGIDIAGGQAASEAQSALQQRDPTGGYATGAGMLAYDVGTNPLTYAGGEGVAQSFVRPMALGGLAGAGYAAATGTDPEQAISTGANVAVGAQALGHVARNLPRVGSAVTSLEDRLAQLEPDVGAWARKMLGRDAPASDAATAAEGAASGPTEPEAPVQPGTNDGGTPPLGGDADVVGDARAAAGTEDAADAGSVDREGPVPNGDTPSVEQPAPALPEGGGEPGAEPGQGDASVGTPPGADAEGVTPRPPETGGIPVGAVAGAGVGYARTAPQGEDETWDDYVQRLAGNMVEGAVGGAGLAAFATSPRLRAALGSVASEKLRVLPPNASGEEGLAALRDMYARPPPQTSVMSPGQIRMKLTRLLTDDRAPLANPAPIAYMRSFLASAPAAETALKQEVGPSLRAVNQSGDLENLRDYLTLNSNLEQAAAIGQRVEAAMLRPPAETSLTDVGPIPAPMIRSGNETAEQLTAARAAGQEAEMNRVFSGGLTSATSQKSLDSLQQEVGPERWAGIQQAAQKVTGFLQGLLKEKLDAGIIDQDTYDLLTTRYPNWVPTRIMDYLDQEAGPSGVRAGKIGLSDDRIRSLTEEGTESAREDPLASMVRLTYQTKADVLKNTVFRDLMDARQRNPSLAAQSRVVPADYTARAGEKIITGFENGDRVRLAVDPALADAVERAPLSVSPFLQVPMNFIRAALTTRNPAFIPVHAAITAIPYMVRTTALEAGNNPLMAPMVAPKVVAALAQGYWDAMKGIRTGTYGQQLADLRLQGGGMFTDFNPSQQGAKIAVADLARSSPITIDGADDLRRWTWGLLSGKWSGSIVDRVDAAPRLAAQKLALARGATPLEATTEARNVSMDFAKGGTLARMINQAVPFFNVGVQAAANPVRTAIQSPGGFAGSLLTTIAAPTAAIEAWNNADPQRKADYDGVSDYYKNRGWVVMTGQATTNADGTRNPVFFYMPLRAYAGPMLLAKQITQQAMGLGGDWGSLLSGIPEDVLRSAEFIPTENAAATATHFLPGGPIGSTLAGVVTGQDFGFSGQQINTPLANQRASPLAKGIAAVTGMPPAYAQYVLRGTGGYGQEAMAASDLAAGTSAAQRGSTNPGDIPIVGGVIGRFLRAVPASSTTALQRAYGLSQEDAGRVLGVVAQAAQARQDALPKMDQLAQQVQAGTLSGNDFRKAWAAVGDQQRGLIEAQAQQMPPALQDALRKGLPPDSKEALDTLRGKAVDANTHALLGFQDLGRQATNAAGEFDSRAYSQLRRSYMAALTPEQAQYIRDHRDDWIDAKSVTGSSISEQYPALAATLHQLSDARELRQAVFDTPRYRGIDTLRGDAADDVLDHLRQIERERPALKQMARLDQLNWYANRMRTDGHPIDQQALADARRVILGGADLVNPVRQRMERAPEYATARSFYGDLAGNERAAVGLPVPAARSAGP